MDGGSLIIRRLAKYFVILTFLTLPVDQWTKSYSRNHYLIHEDETDTTIYQGRRSEIVGFEGADSWLTVQMTYVRNHGASWGFLRGIPESVRVAVLVTLGISFSIGLLWFSYRLLASSSSIIALCVMGLVVGSLGNLVDRIQLGYVVDVLSVRFGLMGYRFNLPAFNVADIIIVFSLFFLITISAKKKTDR